MRISQTLRKPAHWQDFESLCLMLWSAEWNSDDLKKNGRTGQSQHGVDISGHRDGEDDYSGIQCKCKSEGEALTADEVAAEIEKAKSFRPPLRRYVIATTAKKDASLEEFVRLRDVENRKKGLFPIDLKSWEDIVDMLERHKKVLLAYQDLTVEDYLAAVSFDNGAAEIDINPKYKRVLFTAPLREPVSTTKAAPKNKAAGSSLSAMYSILQEVTVTPHLNMGPDRRETNLSFVPLKIVITNEGTSPLDNIKLELHFECPGVEFTYDNVEEKGGISMNRAVVAGINSNIDLGDMSVVLQGATLNPKDKLISDDFFIKVPYDTKSVCVRWILLSKYYNESGKLSITVNPEFEDISRVDARYAGQTKIEDYIDVQELD